MKDQKIISKFPSTCRYCSVRSDEIREHWLFHTKYFIAIHKLRFKYNERIRVECQNCHASDAIPLHIARQVFKKGIPAPILMKFLNNFFIRSVFVNFIASLWRVWLFSIGVLVAVIILQFYSLPVLVQTPPSISFEDANTSKYIGQIVTVNAITDFSLAKREQVIQIDNTGQTTNNNSYVYIPIFSKQSPTSYILVKGGPKEEAKLATYKNIQNINELKDQPIQITGVIMPIDEAVETPQTKQKFIDDVSVKRNMNPPQLVISPADIISLPDFMARYLTIFYTLFAAFAFCTLLQIYIDNTIADKFKILKKVSAR